MQLSMNLDPFRTTSLNLKLKEHVCKPIYSFESQNGKVYIEKACQLCGSFDSVELKTGFGLEGNKSISDLYKEEK